MLLLLKCWNGGEGHPMLVEGIRHSHLSEGLGIVLSVCACLLSLGVCPHSKGHVAMPFPSAAQPFPTIGSPFHHPGPYQHPLLFWERYQWSLSQKAWQTEKCFKYCQNDFAFYLFKKIHAPYNCWVGARYSEEQKNKSHRDTPFKKLTGGTTT